MEEGCSKSPAFHSLKTLESLRQILLVAHGMVDPKKSMAHEARFWGDAPERVMLLLHASGLLQSSDSVLEMCQDLVDINNIDSSDCSFDPPLGVLTFQQPMKHGSKYPSYGYDLVRASNILLMALAACIEAFPGEVCRGNLKVGRELACKCQKCFDERGYLAHSGVYSCKVTRECLARAGRSLGRWVDGCVAKKCRTMSKKNTSTQARAEAVKLLDKLARAVDYDCISLVTDGDSSAETACHLERRLPSIGTDSWLYYPEDYWANKIYADDYPEACEEVARVLSRGEEIRCLDHNRVCIRKFSREDPRVDEVLIEMNLLGYGIEDKEEEGGGEE